MKLLHYSNKPLKSIYSVDQGYEKSYMTSCGFKPSGLWVTTEGKDNWEAWCRAEKFDLPGLTCVQEIVLAKTAEILWIKTSQQLLSFHKKYSYVNRYGDKVIDWVKVAKKYDGVVIAPYQWEHRLDGPCKKWYYTWDCASGCIWDANAVENIIEVMS